MHEAWIAALSALITGLLSLVGVYLSNRKSAALIAYRLEQLERKQAINNGVIERMYKVEVRHTEAEHDIRDMKGARKND